MSRGRTAVVAMVALGIGVALGFAFGFVLGGGGGAEVADHVAPEVLAPLQARPVEPRVTRPDNVAGRATRQGADAAATAAIEQAIATIRPKEVPTGDGRIEGRVRTRAGEPLADIQVTASLKIPYPRFGPPWNDMPVAEQVTRTVERRRFVDATTRTTTTDEDGRYVLTELVRAPHDLKASSEHYRFSPSDKYRGAREPDATVDLVGDPIVKLTLALTLADGTEPKRASVAFEGGPDSIMQFHWYPTLRTTEKRPGTYKLIASAGPYKELTATLPSITLVHGEPPDEIHLQLLPRPGIAGRVVLPAASRPDWGYVGAELAGPDTTPESVAAGRNRTLFSLGEKYRFAIPDLAPGRYLVVAWSSTRGLRVLAHKEVEVKDAPVLVELAASEPERKDHLEIVARGADGETLSGYSVGLRFRGARSAASSNPVPISRPDGPVWVQHLDAARTPGEGTYTVAVSHPSYGVARAEYRPGPAAHVEVTFREAAFVDVTVAGAPPELVASSLRVALADGDGRRVRSSTAAVGPDLRVRVGPAQPGAAQLSATIVVNNMIMTIARHDLHVRGGDNTATFTLPTLHTLRLEWADPAAGAGLGVRLQSKTEGAVIGSHYQRVPASGRVVLRFVPAGEYELTVGEKKQDVTLPGTELLRF